MENVDYIYDIPANVTEDVTFDLVEIEDVKYGDPFNVVVNLEVFIYLIV